MLKNIRTRGNKWIVAAATIIALLETTGAGLKWG
jgi:hypothetical protein